MGAFFDNPVLLLGLVLLCFMLFALVVTGIVIVAVRSSRHPRRGRGHTGSSRGSSG